MYNELEIIVAVDETGGFGKDGKIPWHFTEDLKHFKELTTGNICIMGRKTYEDILEMKKARNTIDDIKEILPNRTSFVITGRTDITTPGATKAKSLSDVMMQIPPNDPRRVFVIGGERLFIEALASTVKIHLTLIPGVYHCDKRFPVKVLTNRFKITAGEKKDNLQFLTYTRIK